MSDLFLSNSQNPFIGSSTNWIKKYISTVENLLHQNSKDFVPPTLKNGQRGRHLAMPWMVPTWQKGLEIARKELSKRESKEYHQ